MNVRSISAFGVILLILGILAGVFYIRRATNDLALARQQAVTADEQLQTLKETLTATEQAKDAALAAQAVAEAKLVEVPSPRQGSTTDTAISPDEFSALKVQLSEARAALQYARKISGYWRDLFDYTKDTRPMITAGKNENVQSGPEVGAAAAVVN